MKIKKCLIGFFAMTACLSLCMAGGDAQAPGDAAQVWVCVGGLIGFAASLFIVAQLSRSN
ncbi:MAG: hypothetical protein HOI42_13870 [Candidatus Marinimicrobia bacterium]|jgi:ligand-binding sensor protein|nr:hypothetical protein [Candidatus Neomarinimicrobiota bacterium]